MSTCKRMWTDREIRSMAVDSVENKSNLKVFENIVDKDGHKRFVEGDIDIRTIEGVTKTYGKWSLSGNHLMIVLGLALADAVVVASGVTIAELKNLPDWIFEKIVPLFGQLVSISAPTAYADDFTSQNFSSYISKDTTKILINKYGSVTLTANRNVRIQFDMLIDNE